VIQWAVILVLLGYLAHLKWDLLSGPPELTSAARQTVDFAERKMCLRYQVDAQSVVVKKLWQDLNGRCGSIAVASEDQMEKDQIKDFKRSIKELVDYHGATDCEQFATIYEIKRVGAPLITPETRNTNAIVLTPARALDKANALSLEVAKDNIITAVRPDAQRIADQVFKAKTLEYDRPKMHQKFTNCGTCMERMTLIVAERIIERQLINNLTTDCLTDPPKDDEALNTRYEEYQKEWHKLQFVLDANDLDEAHLIVRSDILNLCFQPNFTETMREDMAKSPLAKALMEQVGEVYVHFYLSDPFFLVLSIVSFTATGFLVLHILIRYYGFLSRTA
jgi:hypothetical protein